MKRLELDPDFALTLNILLFSLKFSSNLVIHIDYSRLRILTIDSVYLTEASLLILPDLLISWIPSSGSSDELLLSRLLKLNFRETPDEDLTEDIELLLSDARDMTELLRLFKERISESKLSRLSRTGRSVPTLLHKLFLLVRSIFNGTKIPDTPPLAESPRQYLLLPEHHPTVRLNAQLFNHRVHRISFRPT